MERGFFHPTIGYWQTIADVPPDVLSGYPSGTVEVPLKPGAGYEWDGSQWSPVSGDTYVPPQITKIQFVRAMRALDLWDAHKATIEKHPDWPYITILPREDALTLDAAQAMGATPEQMDAIWILGVTL